MCASMNRRLHVQHLHFCTSMCLGVQMHASIHARRHAVTHFSAWPAARRYLNSWPPQHPTWAALAAKHLANSCSSFFDRPPTKLHFDTICSLHSSSLTSTSAASTMDLSVFCRVWWRKIAALNNGTFFFQATLQMARQDLTYTMRPALYSLKIHHANLEWRLRAEATQELQ